MSDYNIKFNFIHQEKFLNLEDINTLVQKFENINKNKTYISPQDHIIQLTSKETYSDPTFSDTSSKIEQFFNENLGIKDLKLSKLWLVTSHNKITNSSVLPYIPHFDKHRCLKAMVYLHDVTEKHGPIYLGRTNQNVNIESRRNTLPSDYKKLGLNTISDKDIADQMIPMTGSAGDVIFFDTNAPHKAGIVSEGYERKVLRFDFDLDGLNPKTSFIKKLLNRILN